MFASALGIFSGDLSFSLLQGYMFFFIALAVFGLNRGFYDI